MPAEFRINLADSKIEQTADVGQPRFLEKFGSGCSPVGLYSMANGTGNNAGNVAYRGNESGMLNVPAGGSITISLKGANGELDAINKPLSFASVKAIVIERVSASGCVGFGPNGNASCANLGFDADGSFVFGEAFVAVNMLSGWTIATNANVTFTNGGGANVTIKPRFFGVGG
jgi:hypothetical protein